MKANLYLIGGTLVAALGGLLFGFDTAVISGTTDALKEVFHLQGTFLGVEGFWLGLTVASALVGTIIVAVAAGKPADIYGRRETLMVIALLYLASAIGCRTAVELVLLLVLPICRGFGNRRGLGAVAAVYRRDIAGPIPRTPGNDHPAQHRIRHALGFLLELVHFTASSRGERMAMDVRRSGVSVGIVLRPLVLHAALAALARGLRPHRRGAVQEICDLGADADNVDEELQAIQASLALDHHSIKEPLFRWQYRTPIFLVVAIAMFNQLSGINAVLYYAPTVFQMAGAPRNAAMLQTVAIGGTMLIFVILALLIIDHFGRRNLMIVGSIGYILSLGATAWAFYTYGALFAAAHKAVEANIAVPPDVAAAVGTGGTIVLVSLLVFIASHSFGQGAVIWVFISEIFPNRVRARGQALGCFTHWIMAAVISWTFPIFAAKSGAHTFAFYCAMMVLQLLWAIFLMPETKGIPLEEIQKKLESSRGRCGRHSPWLDVPV